MQKKQKHESMSVTGHRWHKLPFGNNEKDPRCETLVKNVTEILEKQLDGGISHVICGMALGFDTLVAEAVIRLQQTAYHHITLEAALFCPGQSEPWTMQQKQRLENILQYCLKPPTVTSTTYAKSCEMIRNKYMVDNSGVLLACWDGRPSGTGNTVKYAISVGVPYMQLNPNDLEKAKAQPCGAGHSR